MLNVKRSYLTKLLQSLGAQILTEKITKAIAISRYSCFSTTIGSNSTFLALPASLKLIG